MGKSKRMSDAVEILRRRYVIGRAKREASLAAERTNARIARMLRAMRVEAGLTQKRLADFIGTTQSVVSRLEDADYRGHSLSILRRIAQALNRRIVLTIIPEHSRPETGPQFVVDWARPLRSERGPAVGQLAQESGKIAAMEDGLGCRPQSRTSKRARRK